MSHNHSFVPFDVSFLCKTCLKYLLSIIQRGKRFRTPDRKHLRKILFTALSLSTVEPTNFVVPTILILEVTLSTFFDAVIMQTLHETILSLLCDVGLECVPPFPPSSCLVCWLSVLSPVLAGANPIK